MEKHLPLPLLPLLLLGLCGCADPGIDLLVELRTDLEPGVDFTSIRTILDDGPTQERAVFIGEDWMTANRIAEFPSLLPGAREVRVVLLDDAGAVVVDRPTTFVQDDDYGLRVTITRDCVGVVCPGPTDARDLGACHGGACVSTDCIQTGDGFCPDAQCATDADCGADAASCTNVRCVEGLCMEGPSLDCDEPPLVIPPSGWVGEEAPNTTVLPVVDPPGTCLSQFRVPFERVLGLRTLADGTLIVHGTFLDTITLGDTTHTTGGDSYANGIVAGFDPSGTPLWSISIASEQHNEIADVAEIDGVLYVAGYFKGTASLGRFAMTSTADSEDGFIARIDTTHVVGAVRTFGGDFTDRATSIAAHAGNLFVGGYFQGPADFLGTTHTSAGIDGFVLRVRSSDLARVTSWTYGSSADDRGFAIDASDGSVFVGGMFRGELRFGDDILFTSELDGFVAMSDLGGAFSWGSAFTFRGMDYLDGVMADGDYVVAGGTFANILDEGMSVVRVYRRNGSMVWEQTIGDRYMANQGANPILDDGVAYMASVVTFPVDVAGVTIGEGGGPRNLLVTAQDVETGELLWHQVGFSEDDVFSPTMTFGQDGDLWMSGLNQGELHCSDSVSSVEDGDVAIIHMRR